MSERTVRFYFAFNSPFAFLANTRVESILDPHGVTIDARPVYSPRTGPPPSTDDPKIRYLFEDVGRFAKAYGLDLRPGPFVDTRKACLGFLHARDHGKATEYRRQVYRARWLEGKNIEDDYVLAAIADLVGLEAEPFRASIANGGYAAELTRLQEEARADGVFGLPFFVHGNEHFWGNDRLEWLAEAVAR